MLPLTDVGVSLWLSMFACVCTACGQVAQLANDADVPEDAVLSDAPVRMCDPTHAWGTPHALETVNGPQRDVLPMLSRDENTLFFASSRRQGATDQDIWTAKRPSRTSAFGAPTVVSEASSPANDSRPWISADLMTLYLHRVDGSQSRIFAASRPTAAMPFSAPVAVGAIDAEGAIESAPYFDEAEQRLWFVSDVGANGEIMSALRVGQQFSNPEPVSTINTSAAESVPVPSMDGQYLLFSRTQSSGVVRMFIAHRGDRAAAFRERRELDEVFPGANVFASWLSPDNCRLYFSSDRGGSHDLYMVEQR